MIDTPKEELREAQPGGVPEMIELVPGPFATVACTLESLHNKSILNTMFADGWMYQHPPLHVDEDGVCYLLFVKVVKQSPVVPVILGSVSQNPRRQ